MLFLGQIEEKWYFCKVNGIYGHIKKMLCDGGIGNGEARAVALLLLEKVCGLTVAEALTADALAVGDERARVLDMARRVAGGEPVQYVLGEADFCGLSLYVKSGVLIPRPETQELVEWVVKDCLDGIVENCVAERAEACAERILDICTGSGCVAVALEQRISCAEVEAWDVSAEALDVARVNVERCGVGVTLKKVDVLNDEEVSKEVGDGWDVIVSNPPYVCEEEAVEMEACVLDHEPRLALFVPDEDPLLFYRQIARIGMKALRSGGRLYFEINRRFGNEVLAMLNEMGYVRAELRQDFCGNDRMVKAIKE